MRLSATSFIQGRAFVHRDVVRLIALDFILRFILAGAAHMPFVIDVLEVDPDNLAAHISCFRIPGHVIANRELMRLALPVIKADYNAFDAYSCADDVKVAAPIHAMGGDQDPYITLGDLYGWGRHTDAVQVTMFDGGHFYLKSHIDAVAVYAIAIT